MLGLMHAMVKMVFWIAFVQALAGCVTDISRDPRYGTDYAVGDVYRVKVALFADRGFGTIFGTYHDPTLQVVGKQRGDLPSSLQTYQKDRNRWRNIAGVVVPDTKLRITKIKMDKNPEMGRAIWVEAEILDGELAGTKHVELHFISTHTRNDQFVVDVPMVDKNILERLTKQ